MLAGTGLHAGSAAARVRLPQRPPLPAARPHHTADVAKPVKPNPEAVKRALAPPVAPAPPSAVPARPSDCLQEVRGLAEVDVLPDIMGPGACGGTDLLSLKAIRLAAGGAVAVSPPATLRCATAKAIIDFVRAGVVPTLAPLGSPVRVLRNFDSYSCRGRNRVPGAKLSEHGKANALDVRYFELADQTKVFPTDPKVDKDLRAALRREACARFTTVLGPGSDGYHRDHIHLDLAQRHNGYRICHWELRDPEAEAPPVATMPEVGPVAAAPAAASSSGGAVPLPRARPAALR